MNLVDCFLTSLGQVHGQHQAPFVSTYAPAGSRRCLLCDLPLRFQVDRATEPKKDADRQEAFAKLACQRRSGWRLHRRYCQRHVRLGERPHLQDRVAQGEPVGFDCDGLGLGEQADDDVEGFLHHGSRSIRVDAKHQRVGDQRAGSDAEEHPATGEVVQQRHPFGDEHRVVVGQADNAGPQFDVLGAFGGYG